MSAGEEVVGAANWGRSCCWAVELELELDGGGMLAGRIRVLEGSKSDGSMSDGSESEDESETSSMRACCDIFLGFRHCGGSLEG